MNFTYNMTTEKFNTSSVVEKIGDYQGPETVSITINEDGFMDHNGNVEISLSSNNPNHIVFMDILDNSQWFDFENTPSIVESIGPFINLKKETEFAPKSVFDEMKSHITPEGVITYAPMEPPMSKEAVISHADNIKTEVLSIKANTVSDVLITHCDKMLAILDWIIYESNDVPSYKIILPTFDSLSDFNDIG